MYPKWILIIKNTKIKFLTLIWIRHKRSLVEKKIKKTKTIKKPEKKEKLNKIIDAF